MTESGVTDPARLADRLVAVTQRELSEARARHLRDGLLPRVFGGHVVAPDATADLIFTLGGLSAAGLTDVDGHAVDGWLSALFDSVDGEGTHTFGSYRVAETLATVADSLRSDPWQGPDRDRLAAAVDSTTWIDLLDLGLPANYAAVLARCEIGRESLGLFGEGDAARLDGLLDRTRTLFDQPSGLVDDSGTDVGRIDMYAVDTVLFCEPFAERIGPDWDRSAEAAADLVRVVMSENGAALCWGRSTGALAVVHLIEFAAMQARRVPADAAWWLAAADHALTCFEADGWIRQGLTTAHQHRSPYGYRGPARRLQMTFDLLGKLAWTAAHLRDVAAVEAFTTTGAMELFPAVDEVTPLGDGVAVWSYRDDRLSFVVPLVGGSRTDYLPAPSRPGVFEVPVDSERVVGVPVIDAGGHRYAPSGRPERFEHRNGELLVSWSSFGRVCDLWSPDASDSVAATRSARLRVDGGDLVIEENLTFEEVPEAVSVAVAESERRPLHVEAITDVGVPLAVRSIDVAGMAEWRSFWGELTRVHEIDLTPALSSSFTWRVRPKWKIASTNVGHHYIDAFYEALRDRVAVRPLEARHGAFDPDVLDDVDAVHLHWPEWDLGWDVTDVERHRRAAASITDRGLPVVWSAHNFEPHAKQPELYGPMYAEWARHADIVLHHSEWSRREMCRRYDFRADALHVVIPHGHWGHLVPPGLTRESAELTLRLPPTPLRLGIVGAPRAEKDCELVMDAVMASGRDDIQLCVWSLRGDQTPPDDSRIIGATYAMDDRLTYETRVAACDAIVLPFVGDTMAATGTVGDVIAHGTAAICSDWPYLAEHLGDAAIVFGSTSADLTALLDHLTPEHIESAAAAAALRRGTHSFEEAARLTVDALAARVRMSVGPAGSR